MAELSTSKIKGDLTIEGNLNINRTNINTTELQIGADVVNAKKLNAESLSLTGDLSTESNLVISGSINSMKPDGYSPIVVISKTECPNLNVNYLQGYTADDFMKVSSYNGKLLPEQLPEATTISLGITQIGTDSDVKFSYSYPANKFINPELMIKGLARGVKTIELDANNIALITMDDGYNNYGTFIVNSDSDSPYIKIEFEKFSIQRNIAREIRIVIRNNYINTSDPEYVADEDCKKPRSEFPKTGTIGKRYFATDELKTYVWVRTSSTIETEGTYKEVDNVISNNSCLNVEWPDNIYWSTGTLTMIDDRLKKTDTTTTNTTTYTDPQPFLSFKPVQKIEENRTVIDVIDLFTYDDGANWYGNVRGLDYKKV